MSTTLPLTYDDCIVLFSPYYVNDRTKDHRSKLFLSELKHHAEKLKNQRTQGSYLNTDLDIDVNNMESAKGLLFEQNQKYGVGDNDLHVEWVFWLASFIHHRSNKTKAQVNNQNKSGDAIVNLIRRLANAQPGSFEELVALLIQKLMVNITDANGTTLLPIRSSWSTASDFIFNDFNNVNLINNIQHIPTLNGPIALIASNHINQRAIERLNLPRQISKFNIAVPPIGIAHNNGIDAAELIQLSNLVRQCLLTNIAQVGGQNNANGCQIAQYFSWESLTHSGGTPLIPNSNDILFKNQNAHISMDNFFIPLITFLNNAGQVNATNQAEFNKLTSVLNNLLNKLRRDTFDAKEFGFNQDAFFLKLFLNNAVKNTVLPVSSWFTRNTTKGASNPQETYYRRLNGEIWERLPNGGERCVEISDPQIQPTIKKSNKCFGLGVEQQSTVNPALTCANYFKECINGGDLTKCKAYLMDNSFWLNASKEVQSMLPHMAYSTLKSFQFETYDEFSKSHNRSFKMIQTWQQWLDACKKSGKLQPNDLVTISGNVKLQEYLNALVDKVNNNPAILNTDYYGEKPSDLNAAFRGTLLAKRGLNFEVVPKSTFSSQIINLQKALSDSRNRAVVSLGQNIVPGVRIVLSGGGMPVIQLQADILEGQYLTLKNRLKQSGKDLATGDDKKIQDLIKELKEKERKLNEFIVMTDRYADLLQVFGQTDKETVLTVDHLEQFTQARDNYFNKVSKKQTSLMSIIQAISDKVSEVVNKTETTPKKTVPLN